MDPRALVGAAFDLRALWLLPLGIAWSLAGAALAHPAARIAAVGRRAGEFVERLLQLGVNTDSFVRVGAFALAHAGLSSAIVALMDAAESGIVRALVLVAGNAIVIVLETLVVSIQTTRLVLFEFFTRFLAAGGRAFRPLPRPPATTSVST